MKKGYILMNKVKRYNGYNCRNTVERIIKTPSGLLFRTFNIINFHGVTEQYRITEIFKEDDTEEDILLSSIINKIPEMLTDNCLRYKTYQELINAIYDLDEKMSSYLKTHM